MTKEQAEVYLASIPRDELAEFVGRICDRVLDFQLRAEPAQVLRVEKTVVVARVPIRGVIALSSETNANTSFVGGIDVEIPIGIEQGGWPVPADNSMRLREI